MCVVVHIVNYTRRVQSFIYVTLVDLCCQHRLIVDYTKRVQSFIYLSLVDLCCQHRFYLIVKVICVGLSYSYKYVGVACIRLYASCILFICNILRLFSTECGKRDLENYTVLVFSLYVCVAYIRFLYSFYMHMFV